MTQSALDTNIGKKKSIIFPRAIKTENCIMCAMHTKESERVKITRKESNKCLFKDIKQGEPFEVGLTLYLKVEPDKTHNAVFLTTGDNARFDEQDIVYKVEGEFREL